MDILEKIDTLLNEEKWKFNDKIRITGIDGSSIDAEVLEFKTMSGLFRYKGIQVMRDNRHMHLVKADKYGMATKKRILKGPLSFEKI